MKHFDLQMKYKLLSFPFVFMGVTQFPDRSVVVQELSDLMETC
jgi:hypothetical protein